MTKTNLIRIATFCIVLAITTASHAQVQNPILRYFPQQKYTIDILPPPEFDRPYTGKLTLKRFQTIAALRAICESQGVHRSLGIRDRAIECADFFSSQNFPCCWFGILARLHELRPHKLTAQVEELHGAAYDAIYPFDNDTARICGRRPLDCFPDAASRDQRVDLVTG